jgi:hypothetical protein
MSGKTLAIGVVAFPDVALPQVAGEGDSAVAVIEEMVDHGDDPRAVVRRDHRAGEPVYLVTHEHDGDPRGS